MDWFGRGLSQALNAVTIAMRPELGGCDGQLFFLIFLLMVFRDAALRPNPWDWAYNGKCQLHLVRAEGPDTNHCNLFSFSPLLSGQFVSCVLFLMTKVFFNLVINLIKFLSIFKTSSSLLPTPSHVVNVTHRRLLAVTQSCSGFWDLGLTSVDQFTPESFACPGGEDRSGLWGLVLVPEV